MRTICGAGLQDLVSPHGVHAGVARAIAGSAAHLVWVQDAASRADFGSVHARGLAGASLDPGFDPGLDPGLDPSFDPGRLLHVRVRRPIDALWAMEEALTAGLAVVGEIAGAPAALDFTATRRLEARSRAAAVTCLLVRTGSRAQGGSPQGGGSSAARYRWRIMPQIGLPDPHDPKAPGRPRWLLELLRARERPPACWLIEASDGALDEATLGRAATDEAGERAPHRLRVVSALAAGGVEPHEVAREGGRRSRTNVVRLGAAGRGR